MKPTCIIFSLLLLSITALVVALKAYAATPLLRDLNVVLGATSSASDAVLIHPLGHKHSPICDDHRKKNFGGELYGGDVIPMNAYGRDDRRELDVDDSTLPPELRLSSGEKKQLRAVGGVLCDDGTIYAGFAIDTSNYGINNGNVTIATTAHSFFKGNGESRGDCYFKAAGGRKIYKLKRIKVGTKEHSDADKDDWAFAEVEGLEPFKVGQLKLLAENIYDYDLPPSSKAMFINGSYLHERGLTAVSLNCMPDSKRKYSYFSRPSEFDWQQMLIHNCDFTGAGSGGPMIVRTSAGLRVIGINVGDTGGDKHDGKTGIEYNPPYAMNYSRRVDKDIENEFKKYIGAIRDP